MRADRKEGFRRAVPLFVTESYTGIPKVVAEYNAWDGRPQTHFDDGANRGRRVREADATRRLSGPRLVESLYARSRVIEGTDPLGGPSLHAQDTGRLFVSIRAFSTTSPVVHSSLAAGALAVRQTARGCCRCWRSSRSPKDWGASPAPPDGTAELVQLWLEPCAFYLRCILDSSRRCSVREWWKSAGSDRTREIRGATRRIRRRRRMFGSAGRSSRTPISRCCCTDS